MFRRTLIALALVAGLGIASFGVTSTAEAHGCGRGGGYGYRGHYGARYAPVYGVYPPVVYRNSYYPASYYYGAPAYRDCYHGHCHDRGGVYFSVGF